MLALPAIDDGWYADIMDVVKRADHSYAERDLHHRAAELFYNTIKGHNFIDGNKRSSIVLVYLFYILNRHYIVSKLDIRKLAKRAAKSRCRGRHDSWTGKLAKTFEHCTEPMKDMDVLSHEE